jgi:hypothetical protein
VQTFVAKHGLSPEEALSFDETPFGTPWGELITDGMWRAVLEKPDETAFILAAQAIEYRGERVSPTAIARELNMPRVTFTRWLKGFGSEVIKRADQMGATGIYAESRGDESLKRNGRRIRRDAP